jgi:hypothetical protein
MLGADALEGSSAGVNARPSPESPMRDWIRPTPARSSTAGANISVCMPRSR